MRTSQIISSFDFGGAEKGELFFANGASSILRILIKFYNDETMCCQKQSNWLYI